MALVFPNDDALCAALKSGLVPADVQRGPVRFRRTEKGELELEPVAALAPGKRAGLKNAGVIERDAGAELTDAPCWAAALAPTWLGEPDAVPPLVLFLLPDTDRLLTLCGELLRLGCDRQELRVLPDGRALVRVREAPYFVVARALEPKERLTVFAPAQSDALWVQLGWHHPLSEAVEQPAGAALLVHSDGRFETLPDGPYTALDSLVFPVSLPEPKTVEHAATPPRIAVRMRLLSSSKAEEPALWLVRDGLAAVEALVKSAPEATLDGVLFAVAGNLVVLKVRAGREKTVVALPGDGFVRVAELPNLYAPLGASLEPPLSRERLRDWLAPDPEAVVWLAAKGGTVVREQIADLAFRPLSDWVDYVIDMSATELLAWVQSSTFDFQAYEGPSLAPERRSGEGEAGEDDDVPRPRRSPSSRRGAAKTEPAKGPPAAALTLQEPESVPRPIAHVEEQLAREEAAFLALDAQADSPERLAAWGRLAQLNAALQREREAGLAWAHALWEVRDADAPQVARQWGQSAGSSLAALLQIETPTEGQTRAVVAQLMALALAKDSSARARMVEAQAWLDRHDDNLDVRSLWLGRVALSKLAGNDTLGLARARDRVLSRLRRGLSLERDVPRFVRSVGPGSSRDALRVQRVVQQLDAMLKAFDETPRKRSTIEAPPALTRAYVGLTFAWAFARLGNAGRARELEQQSLKALDLSKPVNAVLTRAYAMRIAQAVEGLTHETPLPTEYAAALNALEAFDRYRVDRLRQHSAVLEPQEHFNAIDDFTRKILSRSHGEELSALREISDVAELAKAIEQRAVAAESPQLQPEERARLLDGLLDFLLQLPESVALPLLNRLVALADPLTPRLKAEVLEDALKVAGHFGRTSLVKQLVSRIGGLLSELGGEGTAGMGPLLAASVRSLRRVGLRAEAGTVLSRAAQVLKGENLDYLLARVALAGGFAYLGQMDAAAPIFEEALGHLAKEKNALFRVPTEPVRLARQTARALAMAPTDAALPGLRRLISPLPWITDSYNTNDYFCLSVVELADIIAIGHVGEDLTLSEVTRTFLEEDEYRVRRRIHREAGG